MALTVAHRKLEGAWDLVLRKEVADEIASGRVLLVVNFDKSDPYQRYLLGNAPIRAGRTEKGWWRVALINLRPEHMALALVPRMERFFEIFDGDQDAISSFRQGPNRKIPAILAAPDLWAITPSFLAVY